MFYLYLLSLPFLALSVKTINGKDVLVSYLTTALLLFYFFMRKDNARIFFPKEAKIFFVFLIFILATIIYFLFFGVVDQKNISGAVTIALYLFFYVLLINIFVLQDKKTIFKYIDVFIIICFFVSLYSFLQAILPVNSIVYKLFRNASNAYTIWDPTMHLGTHKGFINLNRITGLAAEPGLWAAFLSIPLCLLLPRIYYRFRTIDFYIFIGILFPFLLTAGRTGFLSLFLAIISFPCFILTGNKRRICIVLAVIVITLSIFWGLFAEFRFGQNKDWSTIERANGMIIATKMFVANPLFGVGIGKYRLEQDKYQFEGINVAAGKGEYPYSYYLSLAAETGIVGLALWLFFLKSIGNKIYKKNVSIKINTEEKAVCFGLTLAFLSIVFGWINIGGINSVYYFFIFAIISVLCKRN